MRRLSWPEGGRCGVTRSPWSKKALIRRYETRVIADDSSKDGKLVDGRIELKRASNSNCPAAAHDFFISLRAEAEGGQSHLPQAADLAGKAVRSHWNAVHLAFLGDAVWELCARNHFFCPPIRLKDYHDSVKEIVRAETQAAVHDIAVTQKLLTAEEEDVLRWGSNAKTHTPPKRFSGAGGSSLGIYKKATAFECLLGYLYLSDIQRLNALVELLLGLPLFAKAGSKQ